MNIQGFQKLTLLDFPGRVACTVFTGGCNLHCPFCHNAGLVLEPHAHESAESDVLSYLEKRRGLLDGVCVTGGEPLLQTDLPAFLQRVKAMGYQIKLDTNGSMPEALQALLLSGLVDYVAMDVKSSPAGYARAIGCRAEMHRFEASVSHIKQSGIAFEFRTTAVKGIHTPADFTEIGKWLGADVPYYIQGFVDSGNLLGNGCTAFSADEMHRLLEAVLPYIPGARLRGISE